MTLFEEPAGDANQEDCTGHISYSAFKAGEIDSIRVTDTTPDVTVPTDDEMVVRKRIAGQWVDMVVKKRVDGQWVTQAVRKITS